MFFAKKTRAPARNGDPSRMSFLQDMVAGEYHLDVLGINLQGGQKTSKKKIAGVSPRRKGAKNLNFINSTRDQGSELRDQPGIIPTRSDQDRSRSCQFCGSNQAKVAKNVAEPILAPEKTSPGIRGGDRHGFSRSIWSQPPGVQKSGKKVAFPLLPIH